MSGGWELDRALFALFVQGWRREKLKRRHVRIVEGNVIYVREHWRGDGALGIKRSRYRLTMDRASA